MSKFSHDEVDDTTRQESTGLDSSPSIGKERKKPGAAAQFPKLLFTMLNKAEELGYSHIVSWLPNGQSFRIHDRLKFTAEVLQKCFQQSHFASFQRQLNLYGFLPSGRKGHDRDSYYHENFHRDQPQLLDKVFRTAIVSKNTINSKTLVKGLSTTTKSPRSSSLPVSVATDNKASSQHSMVTSTTIDRLSTSVSESSSTGATMISPNVTYADFLWSQIMARNLLQAQHAQITPSFRIQNTGSHSSILPSTLVPILNTQQYLQGPTSQQKSATQTSSNDVVTMATKALNGSGGNGYFADTPVLPNMTIIDEKVSSLRDATSMNDRRLSLANASTTSAESTSSNTTSSDVSLRQLAMQCLHKYMQQHSQRTATVASDHTESSISSISDGLIPMVNIHCRGQAVAAALPSNDIVSSKTNKKASAKRISAMLPSPPPQTTITNNTSSIQVATNIHDSRLSSDSESSTDSWMQPTNSTSNGMQLSQLAMQCLQQHMQRSSK